MEVMVSSDSPEAFSEAFRSRIHNRRVRFISKCKSVTLTEQVSALKIYSVNFNVVLLFVWDHTFHRPFGPIAATSSSTTRPSLFEHAPASLKESRKNAAGCCCERHTLILLSEVCQLSFWHKHLAESSSHLTEKKFSSYLSWAHASNDWHTVHIGWLSNSICSMR